MAIHTLTFRNAEISDAERLLEIYRYYVEETAISFECTVPTLEEFRSRIRRIETAYPYLVAVRDHRIIGYCYVGPFVGREAYGWSVETTIYLDPAERHHGTGKQLYLTMEQILKRMHILNLNACIGYTENEDAHLTNNSAEFHAHMGYHLVGTFHDSGYKFSRWYDMIWMEKMIGSHPDHPAPVLNYNAVRSEFVGTLLTS